MSAKLHLRMFTGAGNEVYLTRRVIINEKETLKTTIKLGAGEKCKAEAILNSQVKAALCVYGVGNVFSEINLKQAA